MSKMMPMDQGQLEIMLKTAWRDGYKVGAFQNAAGMYDPDEGWGLFLVMWRHTMRLSDPVVPR
jgi:hypothetical protein